jgi:small subunit ribosomal protein S16
MATRIRLRRTGRKKVPEYRIVVAERTDARDGRFIETIGHYRPRENPAVIQVDGEKARAWLAKGATPSVTVRSLFKKAGVYTAPAATAADAPTA